MSCVILQRIVLEKKVNKILQGMSGLHGNEQLLQLEKLTPLPPTLPLSNLSIDRTPSSCGWDQRSKLNFVGLALYLLPTLNSLARAS